MASCSFEREVDGDQVVIRITGTFDRASAVELRERLDGEPADRVVLDFSLVHEFADLGVATLANGLARRAGLPVLRGLRQHQVRLFRYFGVDVGPAAAADGEAADVRARA